MVREQAKVFDMIERLPSEPVTIILSQKGWVRSAKGHEVNGKDLNYKAGDGFFMQIKAKTNAMLYFLDTTGRSYSLMAHQLPSARGFGEPLTTKLKPPTGALFAGMLTSSENKQVLLLSSAGNGFITTISDMETKNKSGKALLKTESATALPPLLISDIAMRVAILTSLGKLAVLDLSDITQMSKGKGNKVVNLSSKKSTDSDEHVIDCMILPQEGSVVILFKNRKLTLKPRELDNYLIERGKSAVKLPKGYQAALKFDQESQ